jgi:hypothetical protein
LDASGKRTTNRMVSISFLTYVAIFLHHLHNYNYKLSLSHMLSLTFLIPIVRPCTIPGTLTLTADNSAFMIIELGSRRVWPVDRGCLLLLGTWSHLRNIRGSVLAHLFLWLVIPTCVSKLITLWYLSQCIWCWYITTDSICKGLFDRRSIFNSFVCLFVCSRLSNFQLSGGCHH